MSWLAIELSTWRDRVDTYLFPAFEREGGVTGVALSDTVAQGAELAWTRHRADLIELRLVDAMPDRGRASDELLVAGRIDDVLAGLEWLLHTVAELDALVDFTKLEVEGAELGHRLDVEGD